MIYRDPQYLIGKILIWLLKTNSVQMTVSILKIGFALSKTPHYKRGCLVIGRYSYSETVSQSVRPYVTLPFFPILAFVSHNVANESCLAYAKCIKYLVWVTLRPLGSMKWGKTGIHTLQYWSKYSQATYIEPHFGVSSPFQSQSQAVVCVSTLRMYPKAGTS